MRDNGSIEWTARMFNVCLVARLVPMDCRDACIIPLYKGYGDPQDCGRIPSIRLISEVGNVIAKALIHWVVESSERKTGDELRGFMKDRSFSD